MSNDLRELTDFFKDRIDELCLLEERIGKQAEALGIVSKNCIAANESHVNKVLLRVDSAAHSIDRINHAAEKVDGHISFCTKHVKLALWLFFGSLFLAICIWVSTYFWYKHVAGEVDEARSELAQANVKLQNKPLFLPANKSLSGSQGDYVRVIPHTETTLSHADGEPYQGVYAEVWTKNSGTDRDWLSE
jgi:hypothetical protein